MVLKSVGITGASGMLGRHIRSDLHKAGLKIFSMSRTKPEKIFEKENWNQSDLKNWISGAQLNDLFQDAQAIIHAGAFVPDGKEAGDTQIILDVNVRSCACIAEWALARKIQMVYVSGATVYADAGKENILEEDSKAVGALGGLYGYSKLLAENLLRFFEPQGLELTILRPSSIYGYGMSKNKMISKFLRMAKDNQVIELTHPINDKINFIHASDVSQAVVKALSRKALGAYNVAYSELYSILDLAKCCCAVAGGGEVKVPTDQKFKNAAIRFDLNIDRARKKFDFNPQVDLRSGLQKMFQEMTA